MTSQTSQIFESFVPVYDTIPEKWEDAREFLVEHLKKISNAVNIREIGWLLDEELLAGKQFFPSLTTSTGEDPSQQFRAVLRKVIDFSPLIAGTTPKAHGITVDANFSLIDLWGAGTDAIALTGNPINEPNITYDVTNIYITSAVPFDRCYAFIEYIQEL